MSHVSACTLYVYNASVYVLYIVRVCCMCIYLYIYIYIYIYIELQGRLIPKVLDSDRGAVVKFFKHSSFFV